MARATFFFFKMYLVNFSKITCLNTPLYYCWCDIHILCQNLLNSVIFLPTPRTLELFVESLLSKALQVTMARNAKTLSPSHVKQCILAESRFDFLRDLVSYLLFFLNFKVIKNFISIAFLNRGPSQKHLIYEE